MKIVVIIPAYNEEKIIRQVVRAARQESSLVIVVDDGSTDRTGQIAQEAGAKIYRHIINLGLGATLATGLMVARKYHPEIVVTMDADGQHRAQDIPSLIEPLESSRADFVVGSRFLGKSFSQRDESVPAIRWFYNWFANLFTFFLFGIKTTDSQSGLRALNSLALEKIDIKSREMEVSSEFFKEVKNNHLRLEEIPIKGIYTKYSSSKPDLGKTQNLSTGAKTFFNLLLHKFIK